MHPHTICNTPWETVFAMVSNFTFLIQGTFVGPFGLYLPFSEKKQPKKDNLVGSISAEWRSYELLLSVICLAFINAGKRKHEYKWIWITVTSLIVTMSYVGKDAYKPLVNITACKSEMGYHRMEAKTERGRAKVLLVELRWLDTSSVGLKESKCCCVTRIKYCKAQNLENWFGVNKCI